MVEADLLKQGQAALDWATASVSNFAITVFAIVAVAHVVPFLTNTALLAIPGPFLAKFTDFWLLRTAMKGHRFETVHQQHKKLGKFIHP